MNPVFPAVRVENVDITQRGYKINQLVKFSGTFKPENIYTDLNYKLYLGADNNLYYPKNKNFEVKAFRAYFEC